LLKSTDETKCCTTPPLASRSGLMKIAAPKLASVLATAVDFRIAVEAALERGRDLPRRFEDRLIVPSGN
jgi:hypothetical protein